MREPHPSLRLDNLVEVRLDLEKTLLEIRDLRTEEKRLERQLGKAKKQVAYYEDFLASAAREMRGRRGRLGELLTRLTG